MSILSKKIIPTMKFKKCVKYFYLCRKSAKKRKPKMTKRIRKVLIKKVTQKFANPIVRPTTVYKK